MAVQRGGVWGIGMAGASFIRQAAWLTGERARAWCHVLAVVTLVIVAAVLMLSHHGLDPTGKPLGTDFISFYAAARLAVTQGAAAAYDVARHGAAQQALFPQAAYGYTTFLYPPPFLLLCLPLAAFPYLGAWAAWLAVGFTALVAATRPLLPPGGLLPLLVYPALLINAGHGQNACLTAACFAGYMVLGGRRPVVAGALLGILVIKPQLALAVPVVLLAGRRWHAIAGAALSAGALCAAATLVLGKAVWVAFAAAAPAGRPMLLLGLNGFAKMASLFAGARLLGLPIGAALGLQAVLATAVLAACAVLAVRRLHSASEGALMACAALLISPWSFDYDLVLLAPPLAWVASRATAGGFLPWEKMVLLLTYTLPLVARAVATSTGVAAAPVVLGLMFLVVCRRSADT